MKIQHLGRRRTLSLLSGEVARAAAEACRAYRKIVLETWHGAVASRRSAGLQSGGTGGRSSAPGRRQALQSFSPDPARLDAAYWKQRLIHRHYSGQVEGSERLELSARIEHDETNHYFPLGTGDRDEAAERALQLHKLIIDQGWENACQRFPRELTLAFHWLDNPLAWTYTTIHTRPGPPEAAAPAQHPGSGAFRVVIAESDSGLRQGLAECIRRMEGFCPALTFASGSEALRQVCRQPAHLLLAGRHLADATGTVWLERLRAAAPGVTGLIYSVHEDSEELFRTTPGGASAYLLRRTPPTRFLEPLREVLGKANLAPEEVAHSVWQYFKSIVDSASNGGLLDRLTGLTQREHEVLALLSKGHPDKLIAERLRISTFTVHGHVRNIFEKLGVHNRVEAVVKYFQK